MATEITSNALLYYPHDTIFNICVVQSTYRARSLKAADGKSSFAEYAMADADRDLFDIILVGVAADVFMPISIQCQGLPDAFNVKEEVTQNDVSQICVTYQINLQEGFESTQIYPLDIFIKDALIAGCLAKWYEHVQLPDLAAEHNYKFDKLLAKVRSALLYRTKRSQIPYVTF
jgi:hypothetical protein